MISRLPSLTCTQGTGKVLDPIFGKPSFSYTAAEESRSGVVTYTQATSPSLDWEKPAIHITNKIRLKKNGRIIMAVLIYKIKIIRLAGIMKTG
jgi:hypothetical protein